jgi:hypothetical protein
VAVGEGRRKSRSLALLGMTIVGAGWAEGAGETQERTASEGGPCNREEEERSLALLGMTGRAVASDEWRARDEERRRNWKIENRKSKIRKPKSPCSKIELGAPKSGPPRMAVPIKAKRKANPRTSLKAGHHKDMRKTSGLKA